MPVLRSVACTSCDQCFELGVGGGGGYCCRNDVSIWPGGGSVGVWCVLSSVAWTSYGPLPCMGCGWAGYCCRNDVSVSPTGVWCVFRSAAWTSYGRSPCRRRARTWAWRPHSTSTTTTSTTAGVFWRGRTCSSAAAWRTLLPPSAESRRSGQWCYRRVTSPSSPPRTLHPSFLLQPCTPALPPCGLPRHAVSVTGRTASAKGFLCPACVVRKMISQCDCPCVIDVPQ